MTIALTSEKKQKLKEKVDKLITESGIIRKV